MKKIVVLLVVFFFLLLGACNGGNENLEGQSINPNGEPKTPLENSTDEKGTAPTDKGNINEDPSETPLSGFAQNNVFSDTVSHWARKEITYLHNRDIVGGYPDGRFGPDDQILRVHAALMLQRELDFDTTKRPNPNFRDVPSYHRYYDVVSTLADEGIINGFEGEFRPDSPLTRAEMAAILERAYRLQGSTDRHFHDVPSRFWGRVAIEALAANNISIGYPDGSFRPNTNITRGEFSVFMARVLNEEFRTPAQEDDQDTNREPLTVHFLDVGQGDASLILLPNGKNILIDAGTRTAGEKVVSYLIQAGITSIDLVVATHAHADHIGGLVPVINEFAIGQVLDSGRTHTSLTYLNYLEEVDEKDIRLTIAEVGSKINLDPNVTITVLNTGSEQKSLNNSSVSLKVEYDQVSFVFTGDAEVLSEGEMANAFDLSAEILQVGHHGSRTSSNPPFLNNVQPEEAILSYGQGNSYNHPHAEVISRFQANGTNLYSTAANGDIVAITDGLTYEIKSNPWYGTGNTGGSTGDEENPAFPININSASVEELQRITGVGPVIAERIIEYRELHGPFTTIDEIQNVSGIGTDRFDGMKDQITV